jgi:hypothetical protein
MAHRVVRVFWLAEGWILRAQGPAFGSDSETNSEWNPFVLAGQDAD